MVLSLLLMGLFGTVVLVNLDFGTSLDFDLKILQHTVYTHIY